MRWLILALPLLAGCPIGDKDDTSPSDDSGDDSGGGSGGGSSGGGSEGGGSEGGGSEGGGSEGGGSEGGGSEGGGSEGGGSEGGGSEGGGSEGGGSEGGGSEGGETDLDGDAYTTADGDCDDDNAEINPSAVEVCDDIDNNCNDEIDEGFTDGVYYRDRDEDGYGDPDDTATGCTAPDGYVSDDTDCDDSDAGTNPGADEVCDRADNNCDGANDIGAIDTSTFYEDADGDGYGDPDSASERCFSSSTYVADDTDCDDDDADAYPGGTEVACDGIDNDCDGTDDGAVYWTPSGGRTTDLTSSFAAGTSTKPYSYSISSSGALEFCDGTWYTNLSISASSVTISSLSGAAVTILDGGSSDSVMSITSSSAKIAIDGVTLQNGVASSTYGGGIYNKSSSSSISLSNCTFSSNTATNGGAIYMTGGSLSVDNCTFNDNVVTGDGGAIALNDATTTISNSEFVSNSASSEGGAIYVGTSGYTTTTYLTVDGSVFDGNVATNGGGIWVYYSGLVVTDSEFYDNAASYSGGAVYTNYNSSKFTTSYIYNNSATYGGGLHGWWGTTTIDCTSGGGVYGNTASYGGGMYIAYFGAVKSTLCDWGTGSTDNSASDVYFGYGSWSTSAYGSAASFTCSGSSYSCY